MSHVAGGDDGQVATRFTSGEVIGNLDDGSFG